jgi:hypothetical protein
VENRVAEELSAFFAQHGLSPVERIPVLGRRGPDISINELKLVIDVKSRKQIPDCFTISASGNLIRTPLVFGVRLGELDLLLKYNDPSWWSAAKKSITVFRWYEHMDEWRKNELPDGITALVLHKPGTPVRNSVFLIKKDDREVLIERFDRIRPSKILDRLSPFYPGTTAQAR